MVDKLLILLSKVSQAIMLTDEVNTQIYMPQHMKRRLFWITLMQVLRRKEKHMKCFCNNYQLISLMKQCRCYQNPNSGWRAGRSRRGGGFFSTITGIHAFFNVLEFGKYHKLVIRCQCEYSNVLFLNMEIGNFIENRRDFGNNILIFQ